MRLQDRKRVMGGVLAVSLLALTGCQTASQPDPNVRKPLPFTKLAVPKAELLDESPLGVEAVNVEEDSKRKEGERKLTIPARPKTSRPEIGVNDYPIGVIKGITDPEEEVTFEINLDNAQITEMVSLFASKEILNFSYLVDPAVKGAVTVNISTTMKAKEVWSTMQHLLWLSGAYASPTYGFINILPFDKMPRERGLFADHEAQPNVEVLFVPIRYKKSADVINILKPFMTDGATATDLADSNTVLIVEAPENCKKLQELIKYLDTRGEAEWPVRCFQCREVESDSVATELQALLPVLGMPVAAATGPSGGAVKVVSLPRLGCIVVSASMEEVLDEVATWVKILDRTDMLDKEEIFFYNVRHSTVDTLSASLDAFFNTTTSSSPSSSSSSTSSRASSTSRTSTNRNRTTTNTTNTTNNTRNNTATTNNRNLTNNRTTMNRTGITNNANNQNVPALHATVFDTDVTVFTDNESNRLTVKTTARTWKMIHAFLQRQDVPPRQVSIRAIITDINLTKSTEYGVSYAISKLLGRNDQNTLDVMMNSVGNLSAETTISSFLTSAGIGILFKDHKSDPLAAVKAVAGEGNTKILSEPHMLALSGAEAQISVGKKVAIPTESTTYSSSTDSMRSNYEYIDTGVIMKVTPYITAGNDVRLVISQEVSSAEEVTNINIPPTIVNKTMSTELVVPDNSTLLMGGMIQTDNSDANSGIPLLKDIPWIGRLFRLNKIGSSRTELLVLLTVNVIDNKSPQEELVRRYRASLEEIEKANRDENLY
ncbi:MAG: hypothetical protein IJT83_01795 [Victivallales bacterium]|nr:hypothetical protein [Victivallales bacterium]